MNNLTVFENFLEGSDQPPAGARLNLAFNTGDCDEVIRKLKYVDAQFTKKAKGGETSFSIAFKSMYDAYLFGMELGENGITELHRGS